MTTWKTSAGKTVEIADMNPYHLHNAIKKLAGTEDHDADKLAELRAEQERRGGPPEDVK